MGQGTIQFYNNVFEDCVFDSHVLRVRSTLGDSVLVVDNIFRECTGSNTAFLAQGVLGNGVEDTDAQIGPTFSDNLFVECSGNSFVDDIYLVPFSPSLIAGNHFVRDRWNGLPSIAMSPSPWQPTPAVLRSNVFDECGYAVLGHGAADGRLNYWGHSSGPYHETLNPTGLGDTLIGDMQFIPWLGDTTSDIASHSEIDKDFSISVHPNPFNSSATIEYALTREQDVKLEIFDVLGRNVETILNDRQSAGVHSILWNAESQPSGVYFATLSSPQSNFRAVKLLLLK